MEEAYSCLNWLNISSKKRLLNKLLLPCVQENSLLRIDAALVANRGRYYVSLLNHQIDGLVLSSPWLHLEKKVHPLDAARFLTVSLLPNDSNIFTTDFISFLRNLIAIIGKKEGIEFRSEFLVSNDGKDEKLLFHFETNVKIKVQSKINVDLDLYSRPVSKTKMFSAVDSLNYARIFFGIGVDKVHRSITLVPTILEVRKNSWKDRITEICIAMATFDISTYVLLEIVDGLPFVFVEKQLPKVQHIHRCLQAIENVRLQRF